MAAAPTKHRTRKKAAPKASLRDAFRTQARAAVLAAAEDVFARDGLHDARIEAVAERAGVAVGTIYNLIGDRDKLISEIVVTHQTELVSALRRTLESQRALPFDRQLHAFLVTLFSYLHEHRHFFRLVLEADGSSDKGALRARGVTREAIHGVYRGLVDAGIAQGALRKTGRAVYPVLLMGMVRELCSVEVARGKNIVPEQSAAHVAEVFLHGASTQ